jgi:hypothetical protein
MWSEEEMKAWRDSDQYLSQKLKEINGENRTGEVLLCAVKTSVPTFCFIVVTVVSSRNYFHFKPGRQFIAGCIFCHQQWLEHIVHQEFLIGM